MYKIITFSPSKLLFEYASDFFVTVLFLLAIPHLPCGYVTLLSLKTKIRIVAAV
jgi:hypothetical protein